MYLLGFKAATVPADAAAQPYKKLAEGDYIRDTTKLGWKTLPEIFESMAVMIPDVSTDSFRSIVNQNAIDHQDIDPGFTCIHLQQVAVEDPIHKPATKLTYSQLNEQITKVSLDSNMVPTIWGGRECRVSVSLP